MLLVRLLVSRILVCEYFLVCFSFLRATITGTELLATR